MEYFSQYSAIPHLTLKCDDEVQAPFGVNLGVVVFMQIVLINLIAMWVFI